MGTLIRSSDYISPALIGWNGVLLCHEGRRLDIIPRSKTSSRDEQNFLIYRFESRQKKLQTPACCYGNKMSNWDSRRTCAMCLGLNHHCGRLRRRLARQTSLSGGIYPMAPEPKDNADSFPPGGGGANELGGPTPPVGSPRCGLPP